MRTPLWARLGPFLVALVWAGLAPGAVHAQEETPEATRQYAAAAKLQNLKSYDLAAEAWVKFINQFGSDPRVDLAHYNLGVCYYLDKNLDSARTTFQTLVQDFPKFKNLEAAYLYLGVTQYSIAKGGKIEACDEAVQTFDTAISKFPKGEYVVDAMYYLGEALYLQGKKAEAAGAYRKLIVNHPKHPLAPAALYAVGVCQEELGQLDEAGKTYETFLKTFNDHSLAAEVSLRRGEALFAGKQYDQAAKCFAAAAARDRFELADYATLRQADCRAQMKQHLEAAALYQSVPTKFPKSEHAPKATVAAGKCYYLGGKYAEARKLLLGLASAGNPSAYEAAHWIAKSWLKENQPDKALEALEKIIPRAESDKNPMAPQLLMDRADAVYEIPQRAKESIELYAGLAGKYPKDPIAPQALYMAAFAALEHGDNAAALKHANAFLASYGKHELAADVMHIQAESNLLLSRFPDALAEYERLLKQYPDHSDAELWRVRRGLVLYLQKKYQETIDALEPAMAEIRRPELVAEAQYLVGSSRMELNQPKEAVTSLEASMAAQPKWRRADETLLTLARAYGQLKDFKKAKAAVSRLIAEFPQSELLEKAQYRLGECAYLAGDLKSAAAAYQQVVDKWPQSPLVPFALHELGCVEMDLGDNAASEQRLSTLLEKYPKHELAPNARFSRGMARHRLGKLAPAVEDLQAFLATNPPQTEKSNAGYLVGLCQVGLGQWASTSLPSPPSRPC